MDELIEALTILRRNNTFSVRRPTNCEHDKLWVHGPPPNLMPASDVERLGQLSFSYEEGEGWYSYRFGSC